jgi:hypothetical protein
MRYYEQKTVVRKAETGENGRISDTRIYIKLHAKETRKWSLEHNGEFGIILKL